jgi:uncharacterized protein (TIGR02453 family)
VRFEGWSQEAIRFYAGLERDNSKAYWTAHHDTYEREVRAPMEALLAELGDRHGDGHVFRPYRDVRFSKDKSPYKTAIGATLDDGGYVQLSSRGLSVGRGYYVMERDQLDRYRRAVDDDRTGSQLQEIVDALDAQGITVTAHEVLKTAPRGYPKDHPRIGLLRHKGLVAWQELPVEPWLATPAAKDRVVAFLEAAEPLNGWLDAQVGP